MTRNATHGLPRFLRFCAGAGAIACTASGAFAATTDGTFAARGIGAENCESLANTADDTRDSRLAALSIWIASYVSHANRTTPERFDVTPIVDHQVLAAIVAQICIQNPTVLVETVVASVLEMTAGGEQNAESDLVEVRTDSATTTLRANALIQVQQALVALDLLDQDDVDGSYGPRTRDALTAFQQERALAPTGLPDPATMLTLFNVR